MEWTEEETVEEALKPSQNKTELGQGGIPDPVFLFAPLPLEIDGKKRKFWILSGGIENGMHSVQSLKLKVQN